MLYITCTRKALPDEPASQFPQWAKDDCVLYITRICLAVCRKTFPCNTYRWKESVAAHNTTAITNASIIIIIIEQGGRVIHLWIAACCNAQAAIYSLDLELAQPLAQSCTTVMMALVLAPGHFLQAGPGKRCAHPHIQKKKVPVSNSIRSCPPGHRRWVPQECDKTCPRLCLIVSLHPLCSNECDNTVKR